MNPEQSPERESDAERDSEITSAYNAFNELTAIEKQDNTRGGALRGSFNQAFQPQRMDVVNAMERKRAGGLQQHMPELRLDKEPSGDLLFIEGEGQDIAIVPRFDILYTSNTHAAGGFSEIFELDVEPGPGKEYRMHLEAPAHGEPTTAGYVITRKGRLRLEELENT
ncbi:MAG: hypothetical protein HYZ09_03580 [Candidatus Kerfeldbacteria bacterium]|nr:hypothetical protein [Candidatus Kerfeldbacteria bacterium]